MPPHNRKQRRAAAATSSSAPDDDYFDVSSIPLTHPPASASSSRREAKTLYEIAAERQAELSSSERGTPPLRMPDLSSRQTKTEFIKISPSGKVSLFDPSASSTSENGVSALKMRSSSKRGLESNKPIPPLPDTILLSLPLSILHFTLSFLAAHQYAQEIPVRKLVLDTLLIAFPVLTFVIHFSHGHVVSFERFKISNRGNDSKDEKEDAKQTVLDSANNANRIFTSAFRGLFPPSPRTIVFLPVANLLGAHLVSLTNEASYYAVMKKAPAIGTLWVWCVVEMSLGPAILGLVGPVGWGVLWRGYGII